MEPDLKEQSPHRQGEHQEVYEVYVSEREVRDLNKEGLLIKL